MIVENVTGVVGFASLVGGLGGAAYFVALAMPPVGIAAGTLAIVAGINAWLTRRK